MKKFILLLIIPFFSFTQDNNDDMNNKPNKEDYSLSEISRLVERTPIFPGCKLSKKSSLPERKKEDRECLNKGIRRHVKKNFEYPKIAKKMGIQAKIYTNFVIDKTGIVTDVFVVKNSARESQIYYTTKKRERKKIQKALLSLENEAMRLLLSLPKMDPATHRGKPLRWSLTIPISFTLK